MKIKNKLAVTTALALGMLTTAAAAGDVTLRIQSHMAPESTQGKLLANFVDDIETMSEGSINIEFFYSAAVVKSAETFDAASTGIIDCDMTNGSYQTGKNPAFQFVADTMGGYDTPMQYLAWVNFGGGREAINEIYKPYNMHFIGAQVGGQESLSSTKPLPNIDSLKNFKFRSPPGLETEIFQSLGAKPVVMDFTEIFTALETGIVDGADASTLAQNASLGLYDIAKHTTYPGFHSMSSDQLACRQDAWDSLSAGQQRIIETAHKKLMTDYVMVTMIENGEAFGKMDEMGVTTYDWSPEDRSKFRDAAVAAWDAWAEKTPEAAMMVKSHKDFLKRIGLSK
ncbi:TRAP-type mannitol/chloroaromatic compound transport system, substrate-binding protein [Cohaesibacter sp. ES.047]|uniref:TRAP transporter substrate-binding protein n=1 Tax=Cohaesibacter sp. ES.047 TaxID=1798205 RepID=UPI000BBFEB2A|nr:TRAP transporter substrate-binding protein [Cohaesibacter sp. ES.047]SNY91617.1 TRAP-type mannitol/chloroaromatic compound transport system, substrate-binding protein [Cohaesibacter sp. ES.047]